MHSPKLTFVCLIQLHTKTVVYRTRAQKNYDMFVYDKTFNKLKVLMLIISNNKVIKNKFRFECVNWNIKL